MKYLFSILLLVTAWPLCAQDKIEREYRVKSREVPQQAREWLKSAFDKTRRLKWYYEETSGKNSYEAKFRRRGCRYSVEFDTDGTIEDVEVERNWSELPDDVRESLQSCFDGIEKFSSQRIQEQWSGGSDEVKAAVRDKKPENITVRYEIEFLAEIDNKYAMWEGTFSPGGELLNYRRIILRTTDNLDY